MIYMIMEGNVLEFFLSILFIYLSFQHIIYNYIFISGVSQSSNLGSLFIYLNSHYYDFGRIFSQLLCCLYNLLMNFNYL